MLNTTLIFIVAGVLLLLAGALSLFYGKTIGLYGIIETRASIFYWIIVASYLVLGLGCLFGAYRLFIR